MVLEAERDVVARLQNMMAAGDLPEHLSKVVGMWLEHGIKCAQANDRKTVRGTDL